MEIWVKIDKKMLQLIVIWLWGTLILTVLTIYLSSHLMNNFWKNFKELNIHLLEYLVSKVMFLFQVSKNENFNKMFYVAPKIKSG